MDTDLYVAPDASDDLDPDDTPLPAPLPPAATARQVLVTGVVLCAPGTELAGVHRQAFPTIGGRIRREAAEVTARQLVAGVELEAWSFEARLLPGSATTAGGDPFDAVRDVLFAVDGLEEVVCLEARVVADLGPGGVGGLLAAAAERLRAEAA